MLEIINLEMIAWCDVPTTTIINISNNKCLEQQ